MQPGVVVLCGLLLSQAAASTPATGRIAGRVVADGANTPIAGARILLLPNAPPRPTAAGRPAGMMWRPLQAQTDDDGRFVIDKVEPGTYRLEVQKTGFAPVGEPGRGATTEVVAGKTTDVALALQKGGVIAGKVLDAQGEPLSDVRMMAMRKMDRPAGMPPQAAAATLMVPAPAYGQQQTNDLGEYRIAGLAPGEYYVAAMPNGPGMSFGGPARRTRPLIIPARSIRPQRSPLRSPRARPSTISSSTCSRRWASASPAGSSTRTVLQWRARW
jgi:Carboxypeptidase regulatory-like domain